MIDLILSDPIIALSFLGAFVLLSPPLADTPRTRAIPAKPDKTRKKKKAKRTKAKTQEPKVSRESRTHTLSQEQQTAYDRYIWARTFPPGNRVGF